MAWKVNMNEEHYLYDYDGDGKLDTVFGVDANGHLVSSALPGGSGGHNVRHGKSFTDASDWKTQMQSIARGGIDGKWKAEPPTGWDVDRGNLKGGDSTGAYQEYEESLKEQGIDPDDAIAPPPDDGSYGAPNITKEDFFTPGGKQKEFGPVVQMLAQKLDIPSERMGFLSERVEKFLPTLEDIDTKELGFLREQYGAVDDPTTDIDESTEFSFAESIAGETAGAAKQQDMYGLQKGASKIGGAMRSIYGGGAAGLRAGAGGQQAIKQGFETAQDKYGLAQREAGLTVQKGVYDLQKKQFDEQKFEEFIGSLSDV